MITVRSRLTKKIAIPGILSEVGFKFRSDLRHSSLIWEYASLFLNILRVCSIGLATIELQGGG
jgi:hypothetical protein